VSVPGTKPESRQYRELHCLYEIDRALTSTLDQHRTLERVLKILADEMGMRRGTITLLDPRTGELRIEVAHGLTAKERKRGRYKIGEGVTGRVVQTGEPMAVPRIGDEPLFLNRTGARSEVEKGDIAFVCVPILLRGRAVGALSADRLPGASRDLQVDVRLLTLVASSIARHIDLRATLEEEKDRLVSENIQLRAELTERFDMGRLVGRSGAMKEVYRLILQVAGAKTTVLIRGESGTGKELVARAIHHNSPRKEGPFIAIHSAALPETLLESEIFGHERGAFTGAIARKAGRFELAEGGTLFLDEIGELSPATQAKLLRVIQFKEFERVGGNETIRCDVRVIAATNRDLETALAKGLFREDLFYRLNVFPIYLPPLRERKTDILLLADHFVEIYSRENRKKVKRISTPAIDLLMMYHWPGNVRELENVIERAVLLCEGEVIQALHLPPTLQSAESSRTLMGIGLNESVANLEREMIVDALKKTRGNMAAAARLLAATERILRYKARKYGIRRQTFRVPAPPRAPS